MAKNTRVSEVHHSEHVTNDLLIQKSLSPKGNLVYLQVSTLDYDKQTTLVYASSTEEAFNQLDELIGALQAIRQDLDVVNKE